jgi:hypothetical protein
MRFIRGSSRRPRKGNRSGVRQPSFDHRQATIHTQNKLYVNAPSIQAVTTTTQERANLFIPDVSSTPTNTLRQRAGLTRIRHDILIPPRRVGPTDKSLTYKFYGLVY